MTLPTRGLSAHDIAMLSADGRVEAVAKRATVPLDAAAIVVITRGFFRIFRDAAFVRDVTLGLATAGDVLAPGAAFGDRPSETGAQALGSGEVLLLSPDAWNARAAADPELQLKLAVSVARRVARLQQRLEEFSRTGVEGRVASSLLRLAEDFGGAVAGGVRLDVPLSQEDLAGLAGTTRESCSSAVAELARRGLVRGGRLQGLVVLDLAGLARTADPDGGSRRPSALTPQRAARYTSRVVAVRTDRPLDP